MTFNEKIIIEEGEDLDLNGRVSVEDFYDRFTSETATIESQNIPFRLMRGENADPKWMTNTIKHETGLKRGIYKRMKRGEAHLSDRYFQLAREMKKDIRRAKRNYEIGIARQAKEDPKGFFQLYRTKTLDRIGPFRTMEDNPLTNKNTSTDLNQYSLSVFTHEDTSS